MKPGERRVVVVPAEPGYGRSGLYPPATPGKPRFVISPNTMLVYEVEVLDNADREGVDARGAELGLPPLAEYERMMEELYRAPVVQSDPPAREDGSGRDP